MITVEGTIKEIVETLPNVLTNNVNKVNYTFGTTEQIIDYLKQKRNEHTTAYPLVMLETPIEASYKFNQIEVSSLTIIIATLSKSSMSNTERLDTTFDKVLFVVKDNLIQALKQSGKTFITSDEIKQTLYFNYGEQEHTATDVWDAIKIQIDITIKDKCLRQINYN
jgi:hypothetical protein